MVFSVFHPELAAAGIESNFEHSGVEYRLGAQRHTIDDYVNTIAEAGFEQVGWQAFCGDARLTDEIPRAGKYQDRPLLLVIEGRNVW